MANDDLPYIQHRGDFLISTDRTLLDVASLHDFLAKHSYWAAGIPLDVLQRALGGSLCFGLYDAGKQVGFARAVTDGATFAYLADVFVLPSYRGRGLSRWLIECVLAHPALQGLRRTVLVTRDAHGLYGRFGFTALAEPDRYMEIFNPEAYRRSADAPR
jgi:GNAT superfamily N-acetyltransferase